MAIHDGLQRQCQAATMMAGFSCRVCALWAFLDSWHVGMHASLSSFNVRRMSEELSNLLGALCTGLHKDHVGTFMTYELNCLMKTK